jgi:cell division protein FtsQ
VLAVVCVLAAGLAWLVLGSPLLAVRSERVMVTSSAPSADEALVAAALEPWHGTPLPRLRTGFLEDAVERVPGVRSASVRRAWPNGLVVDVEGRVPVVAVPTGGRLALLDVDGVRVGGLTDAAPPAIPVVSLPPGRSVEGLTTVLAVLDALPPELLAQVDQVYAGSAETVGFRLVDGSRVEWGSAELSDLKVAVLTVLRERPAQLYDVSAPTMPVTR